MSQRHVPRLMLVTNRIRSRFPLPELVKRALDGGVDVVQVREKDLSELELTRLCQSVLDAGVSPGRITVNGSPRISHVLGIGLHLPEMATRPTGFPAAPYRFVSRSVHSADSAKASEWADFVIAGHVFETSSKPGAEPIGLPGLAPIVRQSPVPVVAIGGIKPANVVDVMSVGAFGVAVLSAINDASDPAATAVSFKKALEKFMSDSTTTIAVTVNGKPAEIASGLTVHDYLTQRGFHERMVVVELNGEILRKAAFATAPISAGDKIEIVHFVGGG